jgi:GDPmannose 4,6-dehydratase
VVATGEQHSVRDFVVLAGKSLGMDIEWRGGGTDEIGVDRSSGRTVVRVDPRYFRPAEVDSLLGDASKIRDKLGWRPQISFEGLVREMVTADLALAQRDALVAKQGYKVYRHHE